MFGKYTSALRTLAHGHCERIKRRLLEQKLGHAPMSNEEYEPEKREFTADCVMEASAADLEAWLAARAAARQGKGHAERAGVGGDERALAASRANTAADRGALPPWAFAARRAAAGTPTWEAARVGSSAP